MRSGNGRRARIVSVATGGMLGILLTASAAHAAGRFSISAGVNARGANVEFDASMPTVDPAMFLSSPDGGMGDVGLYKGRGPVTYDDGVVGSKQPNIAVNIPGVNGIAKVGLALPAVSGFAWAQYDGKTQVDVGASPTYEPRNRNARLDAIHFHTYKETLNVQQAAASSLDSGSSAQPFVAVRFAALNKPGFSLGGLVQYGWLRTECTSCSEETAVVERSRTDYTYRYDGWSAEHPVGPFGVGGLLAGNALVVWNNRLAGTPGPGIPVRNPEMTMQESTQTYRAMNRVKAEVNLHEIVLAAEATTRLGPLGFSLALGPTLNLVGWDLDARTDWYMDGAMAFPGNADTESGMEMALGAMARLSAIINLVPGGRLFVGLHGGFNWVDAFDEAVDSSSAEIDVGSWSGGAEFGANF